MINIDFADMFIPLSHLQNPAELFSHQGRDLAETLNAALPSGHLYGDSDDPDGGKIYGDGNTAWNYLQLDPTAEYGTLVGGK
jgi:hypothetical protein